jgi:hypothetical protein
MNRLIVEPLGAKVNKSGHVYTPFPTNKPKWWESLQLNHLGQRSTNQVTYMPCSQESIFLLGVSAMEPLSSGPGGSLFSAARVRVVQGSHQAPDHPRISCQNPEWHRMQLTCFSCLALYLQGTSRRRSQGSQNSGFSCIRSPAFNVH